MPLSAGTRLGPYEVLSAVGTGGMGEVYRARDTKLQRDVAIKLVTVAFCGDARDQIHREARAAAALNHPHICTIHEIADYGDRVPSIHGHKYTWAGFTTSVEISTARLSRHVRLSQLSPCTDTGTMRSDVHC